MLKESGEREETRRAHAEFFHALAVAAEPHTVEGSQQARWLRLLEVNHDNLRAALTHLKSVEDADEYRSTASALAPLWRLHGHLSEGRRWLVDALASTQDESVLTTKLLTAVGLLAYTQGDYEAAEGFLEESLSLSLRLGVAERVRASLNNLGTVAVARGDHDGARVLFERSMAIARKNDDELGVAYATHNLADLALNERDFVAARDLAIATGCGKSSATWKAERALLPTRAWRPPNWVTSSMPGSCSSRPSRSPATSAHKRCWRAVWTALPSWPSIVERPTRRRDSSARPSDCGRRSGRQPKDLSASSMTTPCR